jgi:hypothetical protein
MCSNHFYKYPECGHIINVRKVDCNQEHGLNHRDRDIQITVPGPCMVYCFPEDAENTENAESSGNAGNSGSNGNAGSNGDAGGNGNGRNGNSRR